MTTTAAQRAIAASLMVFAAGLCGAPGAVADPDAGVAPAPALPGPALPGPALPGPDGAAVPPDAVAADAAPVDAAPLDAAPVDPGPSAQACKQFSVALNYAATNYEDFAYNTAGGGNAVNYGDPIVQDSNVVGRTALREAASSAMNASMTPGLPGDIAAPMQSWSLKATKLLVIMGVHGGGDSLNDTATGMNSAAHDAQMACAQAGTPA